MSDQLEINFRDINEADSSSGNDEYVLDTPDGMYLIEYDNIIWTNNNTTFAATVSATTTAISGISAQHDTDIANLNSINKVTKVYATYYLLSGSGIAGQHLSQVKFTDLPLNFVAVDNVTVSLSSDACGVTETKSQSAFILPKGTYKCRAAASFTGDTYVGRRINAIMVGLHQDTPPARALLISDLKYSNVQDSDEPATVVCYVDGFFYLNDSVSISLKASCIGRFYIGDPPSSNTWTNSTSDPVYNNWCAPIQMILEQLSETDDYNLGSVNYLN